MKKTILLFNGRGRCMESRKKTWLKRGLALLLAAVTLFSTSGVNPGVKAANGDVYSVSTGENFSQVFKSGADKTGSTTLKSVSFKINNTSQLSSVSLMYTVYVNTDTASGTVGAASDNPKSYTVASDGTVKVAFDTPVVLGYGEDYVVQISNYSSTIGLVAGENLTDNTTASIGNNVTAASLMTAETENVQSLPNDVTKINLSADKAVLSPGESVQLTAETDAVGRKRDVTFSSSSSAISVNAETGVVNANSAGSAVITAKYGNVQKTITIYVIGISLASDQSYTYTGSEIKPKVTVNTDTTLIEGNDYSLSYRDNINAGIGKITVTGNGTYAGFSKETDFKIGQAAITQDSVNNANITVDSDGNPNVSGLVINGNNLVQGTDFTATAVRSDLTASGATYTVTVSGRGNYSGSIERSGITSDFSESNKVQLSSVFTMSVASVQYNGRPLTPKITLSLIGGSALSDDTFASMNGTDFTVEYENNKDAGTGTVVLTGQGRYAGTLSADFTITPVDIGAAYASQGTPKITVKGIGDVTTVSSNDNEYKISAPQVHTGNNIEFNGLAVLISFGENSSETLTAGANGDYTVKYENNSEISDSAKLRIVGNGTEGEGNYTGDLTFDFSIIPDFARELTFKMNGKTYKSGNGTPSEDGNTATVVTSYSAAYDGNAKEPDVSVSLNSKTLPKSDYQVTYASNTDAGQAHVLITGLGNYAGKTVDALFTITPKSLAGASVSITGTYTYTGLAVLPESSNVTVTLDQTVLQNDKDYSFTGSDNVNAGTATLTVKGRGNYSGTLTQTYTIGSLSITNASVNPSAEATGLVIRYQDTYSRTGSAIVPDVKITNTVGTNTVTLYDSTDADKKNNATVSASSNTNPGKARVTISGRNNLTGSVSGNFTISNRTFDDLSVTVGNISAAKQTSKSTPTYDATAYHKTYTFGDSSHPAISISDNSRGGTALTEGTDYVVSSAANQAGTAYLIILGRGLYSGSRAQIEISVDPRNITDSGITIKQDGTDENGVPEFTVVDNTSSLNQPLKKGTDYEVVQTDDEGNELKSDWPKAAGQYHIKVKGVGNYTGETENMVYEKGTNINNLSDSLVNPGFDSINYTKTSGSYSVPYIGSNHPKAVLTDASGKTVADSNYDISYSSDSAYAAGSTVVITLKAKDGNENYYGEKEITYTVIPVNFNLTATSGSDKKLAYQDYNENGMKNMKAEDYFCGQQGLIVINESSKNKQRKDHGKGIFTYYYAHQGEADGYDALNTDIKLQYYALGKDNDPIILTSSDFTVSPSTIDVTSLNNRQANAVISGAGKSFSGTIGPVVYNIQPSDIGSSDAKASGKLNQNSTNDIYSTYDGSTIDPSSIILTEYGSKLKYGEDYKLTSIDFSETSGGAAATKVTTISNPGYYTLHFTGIAGEDAPTQAAGNFSLNYYGKKSVKLYVMAKDIGGNGYNVSGTDMITYTGNPVDGGFVLKEGEKALTPSKDYSIKIYSGDLTNVSDLSGAKEINSVKDIGLYTLVFTGHGKYTGSLKHRFKVVGDISNEVFKASPETLEGTYSATDYDKAVDTISLSYLNTDRETVSVPGNSYTVTKGKWTGPGSGNVTLQGNATPENNELYTGKRIIKNNMKGDLSDSLNVSISDAQSGNNNYYAYTSDAIKPNLTVKYFGNELTEGKDYELRYTNDTSLSSAPNAVGTYSYQLVGKGNYAGRTSDQQYTIAYNLSNARISFSDDNKSWVVQDKYSKEISSDEAANKAYVKAQLVLSDGSTTDIPSDAYQISYSDTNKIGNVTVTLSPVAGKSYSTKTAQYPLNGKGLTDNNTSLTIEGKSSDQYSTPFTGSQIKPGDLSVSYGTSKKTVLREGTDYTISYGENTNAGTGTITIVGKGTYTGSVDKTFKITKVSIKDLTPIFGEALYSGKGVMVVPEISLTLGAYELKADSDYTVEVGQPNSKAEETVSIKAKDGGNFTDSIDTKITLKDRDISMSGSVSIIDQKVYDGKVITTDDVTVTVDLGYKDSDGNEVTSKLDDPTEYTVTPVGQLSPDAGAYSFTISAVPGSHFTGQITKTINIVPKDISADDISAKLSQDEFDYTGSAVEPQKSLVSIVYKTGNGDLTLIDKDFDIAYRNNINSQSKDKDNAPQVVLTGKGNYTGERILNFSIGTDLNSTSVNYTDPSFIYDGQAHGEDQIQYTVTGNKDTVLTKGSDYNVASITDTGDKDVHKGESDTVHAGTKTVTLQGSGPYYGVKTFDYTIKQKKVSKNSSAIRIVFKDFTDNGDGTYSTVFDGSRKTSDIDVYDDEINSNIPVDTSNWELYTKGDYKEGNGYLNNIDASSEASAAITMKGDYDTGSDTIVKKFTIAGRSLENMSLELGDAPNSAKDDNSDRYPYDWENKKPIVPSFILHDGSETLPLAANKDYSLEIEGNDRIGKAVLTLTGRGNYSGKLTKTFEIYASLENAVVTLTQDKYYYVGYGLAPTPLGKDKIKSIEVGGVKLDPDDYLVTESSLNSYGTSGILTIEPNRESDMAPYLSKAMTKTYEISSDYSDISASDPDDIYFPEYEYTGETIDPNIVLTHADGQTVSYDNSKVRYLRSTAAGDTEIKKDDLVDIGEYKAIIPLFSDNTDTRTYTVNFSIVHEKIHRDEVNFSKIYTYNGRAQKFTASIYKNDSYLVPGTDYDISVTDKDGNVISEPTECGKYYLSITGKGDYSGSKIDFRPNVDRGYTGIAVQIVPDRARGLTVKAVSNTQMELSWTKSHDVSGYRITYKPDTGEAAERNVATNRVILTDLSAGRKYTVTLEPYVYNRDTEEYSYGSKQSLVRRTTILSPSDITENTNNSGKITLTWNANDSSVDGYEIYRSSSQYSGYQLVAIIPRRFAPFTDDQIRSGQVYYYRLRSYKNEDNNQRSYSTYSSTIRAVAP
jgi:hypothetical protein